MKVELDNLGPFINRLEKFDKDVSKELKKRMRAASMDVVKAARGRVPSGVISGWGSWISAEDGRDLSFDAGLIRRSYKVETLRTRARGVTVAFGYSAVNTSPVGMILEQIGAPTSAHRTSEQFVASVVKSVGPRPSGIKGGKRFLVPAYYEVMPEVRRKIREAIEDAQRKVGLGG